MISMTSRIHVLWTLVASIMYQDEVVEVVEEKEKKDKGKEEDD